MKERVALITGPAEDLGLVIAERLASDGYKVILADLRVDAAKHAAQGIRSRGGNAASVPIDVGDEAAISRAYVEIERQFGRLDILINNASDHGKGIALEHLSLADWEQSLRVNLTGHFLVTRGSIPLMRRNNWGRIITIIDFEARVRASANHCGYLTAMAGIVSYSRVLAGENGRHGITVNGLAPGLEAQDGMPKSVIEAGSFDDIADAAAWLCSDDSSYVTGAILDVNGGAFMP